MADSNDDIEVTAKKYGWSPDQVAYLKSLRGDIPQGPTSVANNAQNTPQQAEINPMNLDPEKAQQIQQAFWAGGTSGSPTSMAKGGNVHTPVQVPGIELQQQMQAKKNALKKMS